jgi:predicted SAM-dependent methyltransferase
VPTFQGGEQIQRAVAFVGHACWVSHMMSREAKAAFYAFAGPIMRMNAHLYRRFRAPRYGLLRVHLGPGQKSYLKGWVNVDANMFTAKCDLWMDLRGRLPFLDGTVDAFYSHHVVEHLPDLDYHFRDVFRCLKPGGMYRVGGPNGDASIERFLSGDAKWFSEFPDRRNGCGGRLDNFIMCRGEHLHLLTNCFLTELLTAVGFNVTGKYLPIKETGEPKLFSDCLATEWESDFSAPHTLILEAEKLR